MADLVQQSEAYCCSGLNGQPRSCPTYNLMCPALGRPVCAGQPLSDGQYLGRSWSAESGYAG